MSPRYTILMNSVSGYLRGAERTSGSSHLVSVVNNVIASRLVESSSFF